jgi:hypothetical protein
MSRIRRTMKGLLRTLVGGGVRARCATMSHPHSTQLPRPLARADVARRAHLKGRDVRTEAPPLWADGAQLTQKRLAGVVASSVERSVSQITVT